MREDKMDGVKRHISVPIRINRNSFSNSNRGRKRAFVSRFHFNGRSSWISTNIGFDPWLNYKLFNYRLTVIFFSFSGVFYGIWGLINR